MGVGWSYAASLNVRRDFSRDMALDYVRLLADSSGTAQLPPHSPAGQMIATEPEPPWLRGGAPLRYVPELQMYAIASRRFPKTLPRGDIPRLWRDLREQWSVVDIDLERSEPSLRDALVQTRQRFLASAPEFPHPFDSLLLALTLSFSGRIAAIPVNFLKLLVSAEGVSYAFRVYTDSLKYRVEHAAALLSSGRHGAICVFRGEPIPFNLHYHWFSEAERLLRQYLSSASEAEYGLCLEYARQAMPQLEPAMQARLALILFEEAGFANDVALRLGGAPHAPAVIYWLQLAASDPRAIAAARQVKKEGGEESLFDLPSIVATLLQERGTAALSLLALEAEQEEAAIGLGCIGLPAAVEALARAVVASEGAKPALVRLILAIDRWPAAAMAGLLPPVAEMLALSNGEVAESGPIVFLLLQLVQQYPGLPEQIRPWLSPEECLTLDQIQRHLSV